MCVYVDIAITKVAENLSTFTEPCSPSLVARQPLRGGAEHKFKGAAQLPDKLMTNGRVPAMSTINFAFLLSPALSLQTPLQERVQRNTCTKPSRPLTTFSSLCSLTPDGGFLGPGCTDDHVHLHTFPVNRCCRHLYTLQSVSSQSFHSHRGTPGSGPYLSLHFLMPRDKHVDQTQHFMCFSPCVLVLSFLFHASFFLDSVFVNESCTDVVRRT